MSDKNKFKEYQDPDYEQFQPKQQQSSSSEISSKHREVSISGTFKQNVKTASPDDKRKTICRIIDREFQRELKAKEDELDEINRRLDQAKQLLAKVRYAVVHNYYSKKSLICEAEELTAVEKSTQESVTSFVSASESGKTQLAIHPSLKKLLGKRPVDYNEILKTRSPRQAAKNATEQFQKLSKKTHSMPSKTIETITSPTHTNDDGSTVNESAEGSQIENEHVPKKPRYVAPSTSMQQIPQINSARGRNQYRHLLVVGNTSKYIGDEEAELATSVTHKWLVYVAAKTAIPVEKIVDRVRFFLHESYKPNDVVDVTSPPYQLAKRGWGEFPIRVQLHFHEHLLQKPLQIYHMLVLDKKHTGLQTMGAETTVELWLNIPNTVSVGESSKSQIPISKLVTPKKEPQEIESSTNVEPSSPSISETTYSNREIKEERIDNECEKKAVIMDDSAFKSHFIPVPTQTLPQVPKICDQIKPIPPSNVFPIPCNSKLAAKPANPTPTLIPLPKILPSLANGPGKQFIKCVSKDGKISLLQLVQDANNPKLFKMILPKKISTNPAENVQNSQPTTIPSNQLGLTSMSQMNAPKGSNVVNEMPLENANRQQFTPVKFNLLKRPGTSQLSPVITKKINTMDLNKIQSSQPRSLLKPGVSLLKPTIARNSFPAAPVAKNNGKVLTVRNIQGLGNKNINVYLPSDFETSVYPAPQIASTIQNESRRHDIELENRFLFNDKFLNMTDAVSWLLKEIPLINEKASSSEFRDSFPFVVPSLSHFQNLLLAKRRNFEWLRAKHINRLIAKHKKLSAFNRWTAKEIILYGRWYGYTPQSVITKPVSDTDAEDNVRDMIKTELLREHLQNDTISFNTRLTHWIDNFEETRMKGFNKFCSNEIIVVDDDGETDLLEKTSGKTKSDKQVSQLFIGNRFHDESMWTSDICRRLQIHLEPEEICDGVMHRSSELVLTVALRSFMEDLLRKCSANKQQIGKAENSTTEVNRDDIVHVVSKYQHFDFLTNKNLGVDRSN